MKIWVLLFKSRKRDFLCFLSKKVMLVFLICYLIVYSLGHDEAHGATHIFIGTNHDLVYRRYTKSHSSCAHTQVSARGWGWQQSLGSGREWELSHRSKKCQEARSERPMPQHMLHSLSDFTNWKIQLFRISGQWPHSIEFQAKDLLLGMRSCVIALEAYPGYTTQ